MIGRVALVLSLASLLAARSPQETPPDREEVRRRITALAMPGCGSGLGERLREIAKIGNAALEELPEMIRTSEGEKLGGLLFLYGYVAGLKEPAETPAVIVNLARRGTGPEHLAAAKIALTIRDERAIAFLIDGLTKMAADEATATGYLESILLDRAGWSHSKEAGDLLMKLLAHPHPQMKLAAIDGLCNLGYAPALDRLMNLGAEEYPIPGRARQAIEKIELLRSPDRAARLVEQVRTMRRSGEVPWYAWALEHILHLKLAETAGPLREEYDNLVKNIGAPAGGTMWAAVLLHAIHKLGGKLSPEEMTLLHDVGRLPPAVRRGTPEEELVKGFDKSVWAPRAERLKQNEERLKQEAARNAPPPRIPEEKLPRIMEDRIRFVLNLEKPDPSYLAPNAALALGEIEEMLPTEVDEREYEKLLAAYLYLARLREGMKTLELILRLAKGPQSMMQMRAAAIVTTIADDRAEAWYLERLKERDGSLFVGMPGRLSSARVREALLKCFREGRSLSDRMSALRALADLGCVEIIPELKQLKENSMEIRAALEKLEIFAAPDRDAKLLAWAKSMARSGDFSYTDWGLDQILRLDLKHLAPEIRAWYDVAKLKWVPSPDPHRLKFKVPWVLFKLGAPITPDEEALLKQGGRRP